MKGYKAYNKGLICRDKQYKIGEVFEEDRAEACLCGMHYCENPLDCLDHYPLIDDNGEIVEMTEVEDLDEENRDTENNKKYCTKKLKIGAKLSLGEMIKAGLEFLFESKEGTGKIDNKDGSQLASSGYGSKLASSGYGSVVANIGNRGLAKAKKGSWIVLAEYTGEGIPICVKSELVDGIVIKEDTWYRLQDGIFKEVE